MAIKEYNEISENKEIEEYQKFDAIEYPKVKELVNTKEIINVNENNLDSDTTENITDARNLQAERQRLKELSDSTGNRIEFTNTAINPVPDVTTAATVETAATATASGSVVTATSTFVGGITIISVAAATVIGASALIMSKDPDVSLYKFDVGANYLEYGMNISKLYDDYNFEIKVSNDTYSYVVSVMEEGVYEDRLIDLTPDRYYKIELIADLGGLGEKSYFTKSFCTPRDKTPKALIDAQDILDYDNGLYKIGYNVFISDYYNKASDTHLDIIIDDEVVYEDYNIEDNYITGEYYNLPDESNVRLECHTTYNNEDIIIGLYEESVEYPDDFLFYKATYNLEFELGDLTDDGRELFINTNFDNSKDINDIYLIEIYSDDLLVDEIKGTDQEINVNIPPIYSNIEVYISEIKINNDKEIVYSSKKLVKNYEIDTAYLASMEVSFSDTSYQLACETIEDIDSSGFKMKIVEYFADGTTLEKEAEGLVFETSLEMIGADIESSTLDLEKIDVSIYNSNDVLYQKEEIIRPHYSLDSYEAKDLVLVVSPTSNVDDLYELNSMQYVFDNVTYEANSDGQIELEHIYDSNLNLILLNSYQNGVISISSESTFDQEINVDFDFDYMLPNAYYGEGFDIKYKVVPKIDGNQVNLVSYNINFYQYDEQFNSSSGTQSLDFSDLSLSENKIDYEIVSSYSGSTILDRTTINLMESTYETSTTSTSVDVTEYRTNNILNGEVDSINLYLGFDIKDNNKYILELYYISEHSNGSQGNTSIYYDYHLDSTNNFVRLLNIPNKTITYNLYQIDEITDTNNKYECLVDVILSESIVSEILYVTDSVNNVGTDATLHGDGEYYTLSCVFDYRYLVDSKDIIIELSGIDGSIGRITIDPYIARNIEMVDRMHIYETTGTIGDFEYDLRVEDDESTISIRIYSSTEIDSADITVSQYAYNYNNIKEYIDDVVGNPYLVFRDVDSVVVKDDSGNELTYKIFEQDGNYYAYLVDEYGNITFTVGLQV